MSRTNVFYCLVSVAVAAAVGCGGDHVDELVAQLGADDVPARRAAALALKELPGDKVHATPALVHAATNDSDLQVRKLSVQALGSIGPGARNSVPELTPLVDDPEQSLSIVTALAIARIDPHTEAPRPKLVKAMRAGNGGVLLEIGRLGDDAAWAVPTLTELLSHELVQVRSLAAHTLGQIGPAAKEAVPALERVAQNRDEAMRAVTVEALARIRELNTKSE